MKNTCVSFRLGNEGYGLPLVQVREIAVAGTISKVPLAPPVVRGLTCWRGRVITLIDASTLLCRPLPPARSPQERLALLFAAPYDHLGMYVHAPVQIGEAVAGEIPQRALATGAMGAGTDEPTLPSGDLTTVSGEIVRMLSTEGIVTHCEAKVLEGFRRKT